MNLKCSPAVIEILRKDFQNAKSSFPFFNKMSKFYVCSYYPECCDNGFLGKNEINYAYAARPENDRCYPKGICGYLPQCCDGDNSAFNNVSLSALYDSTLGICQDAYKTYKQTDTKPEYGYITTIIPVDPDYIERYRVVPLKIAMRTSPISATFCVMVIISFILILLFQPAK